MSRYLWTHDVPVSTSMALVRLLDTLGIKDCAHCEEMRYSVIAYVKGLNPLAHVPDVLVTIDEVQHSKRRGRPRSRKRSLAPGVPA